MQHTRASIQSEKERMKLLIASSLIILCAYTYVTSASFESRLALDVASTDIPDASICAFQFSTLSPTISFYTFAGDKWLEGRNKLVYLSERVHSYWFFVILCIRTCIRHAYATSKQWPRRLFRFSLCSNCTSWRAKYVIQNTMWRTTNKNTKRKTKIIHEIKAHKERRRRKNISSLHFTFFILHCTSPY